MGRCSDSIDSKKSTNALLSWDLDACVSPGFGAGDAEVEADVVAGAAAVAGLALCRVSIDRLKTERVGTARRTCSRSSAVGDSLVLLVLESVLLKIRIFQIFFESAGQGDGCLDSRTHE
jgi:hypothetical protein